jgi:hypothetical protein
VDGEPWTAVWALANAAAKPEPDQQLAVTATVFADQGQLRQRPHWPVAHNTASTSSDNASPRLDKQW